MDYRKEVKGSSLLKLVASFLFFVFSLGKSAKITMEKEGGFALVFGCFFLCLLLLNFWFG